MTIYQNLISGSGFLQGPKGDVGPAANTNITVYEYIATAGQTEFTGVDSKLQTLAYTPTGLIVTLNGSVLNDTTDYVASNGTSILLTQAAAAGDELNAYTFPPFNVANTYTQVETNSLLNAKLNITGGTLTGNISFANGANLLVPVGNTAQRPAASPGYIRYNTDLNTLESANATAWANVGSGSASSGGGVTWNVAVQNTNFITVKNTGYLVNTATGNVTATLPASPTFGDTINLVDYAGYLSANSLILYPNGNKIQGNTSNVFVTSSGASIGLMYSDSNRGWVAYNGFSSAIIGPYTIEYLNVAGGGGGGSGYEAGGGGAGGMLSGSALVNPGTSYTVTVGSGGSGYPAYSGSWVDSKASSGTNSSISNIVTSIGGGGGAQCGGGAGASGGSGGAGGRGAAGGAGTIGQGNPGGQSNNATGPYYTGGGGGGAGATGGNGSSGSSGGGGVGLSSGITGSTVYYAGGGGGGSYANPASSTGIYGPGGNGGGGNGGDPNNAGTPGTTNRGAGGGAGGGTEPQIGRGGGNGGSGVVIIRYLGSLQKASGGVVTISGGYVVHTFNSSGTFIA